jgi:hypothetical protein
MRVNAARLRVIALYFREADISLSVVLHGRKPPIAEAKAHALFDFVCCHGVWLGIFPVPPPDLQGAAAGKIRLDLNDEARKILSGLALGLKTDNAPARVQKTKVGFVPVHYGLALIGFGKLCR